MSIDVKTLFEAGAHYGHKTSRWHPKMEQYIHSQRGGVHIIDLTQTQVLLEEALDFLQEKASSGRPILLVGTKRQTRDLIEKAAEDTGMPFVSVRWFGGMLTNFKTMQERVKRLKDLQSKMDSGELASRYNKLEVQRFQEEINALKVNFGGIQDLEGIPSAIFVADVVTQVNAVREANKLAVPVVGIVDTNADPRPIDFPIPANDDAIKTQELIIGLVADAINRGKASAKAKPEESNGKEVTPAKAQSSAKPSAGTSSGQKKAATAKKTKAKPKAADKTAKPETKSSAKSKTAKKASK